MKKKNRMKWFKSNVLDLIILVLVLVLVVKVFSMPTVAETTEQLPAEETSLEASTTADMNIEAAQAVENAEESALGEEPLAEPAE